MIPKELAKKIRYIQIYTSKAVNDVLAGEYHSVFKGRGMEFDEVREYTPGDEIRTIDWNVTARMGHPFVKRYVEERELTVLFLVDLSASGTFGSVDKLKNEVAAELCALLAFSAIKNNDKVGLIVFTDAIELFIPPAKGVSHVLRLIREVLGFQPKGKRTDIALALDFLGRVTHKRAVVFLVSDFLGERFEKPLGVVAKRHDLVAITVSDPREMGLPKIGLIELEDAETGECVVVDTSSEAVRREYERLARQRREKLLGLFRSRGIDHIEMLAGRDHVRELTVFFRARERRH
jgi:uncharacterized protein (DUF58 family)